MRWRTFKQSPNKRQQRWVLNYVLEPLHTDTGIIKTHEHQPRGRGGKKTKLQCSKIQTQHSLLNAENQAFDLLKTCELIVNDLIKEVDVHATKL